MRTDLLDRVRSPGKHVVALAVPGPGAGLDLTLHLVQGAVSGPVLLVLAGVHGDEYEGVLAIQDAVRRIIPGQMCGTLAAVPVTNLPAYQGRSRTTPADGLNLARVFPGKPDGSVTERIAYYIGEQLIRKADLLLDLHSSGTALTSPTLVGYYDQPGGIGARSGVAARSFGAPVVWTHPTIAPGRTLSMAADLSIPALYTEANGGMRVLPADLRTYTNGILNVMAHLGMIERKAPGPPRYFLGGDGNTDDMPTFQTTGLFRPAVRVLQAVKAGQRIGVVRALDGRVLEEIRAPRDGRIVFLRAIPAVTPGELAVLVAADLGKED